MLPLLPLEISSQILSHILHQTLTSIHHPTFCFCAYHSPRPCSANTAAATLHALLSALPANLADELRRLCRNERTRRKRVEKLHERFYWWTWVDVVEGGVCTRCLRPCCGEGVTGEMVGEFAEVMVLRQFEGVVRVVHEGVVVNGEKGEDAEVRGKIGNCVRRSIGVGM